MVCHIQPVGNVLGQSYLTRGKPEPCPCQGKMKISYLQLIMYANHVLIGIFLESKVRLCRCQSAIKELFIHIWNTSWYVVFMETKIRGLFTLLLVQVTSNRLNKSTQEKPSRAASLLPLSLMITMT